jgi:transcription termination factor Rho
MLLNELQTMASSLGIAGTAKMRKGDLIAAIEENQADSRVPRARMETAGRGDVAARGDAPRTEVRAEVHGDEDAPVEVRAPRRATRAGGPPEPREDRVARSRTTTLERTDTAERMDDDDRPDRLGADRGERSGDARAERTTAERASSDRNSSERTSTDRAERTSTDRAERTGVDRAERNGGERADRSGGERAERSGAERAERSGADRAERTSDRNNVDRGGPDRGSDRGGTDRNGTDRNGSDRNNSDRNGRGDRGYAERSASGDRAVQNGHNDSDDDGEGGRRGRRSRFRDRRRGRGERGAETGGVSEPQVTEDDVLVQVAGIVDVLDNYAFVRTSGYLAGSNDVYVSMSQIKKYGLRRGDAVTGAVRAPREVGDGTARRDKYNPLVRLDTINGMDPDEARRRPEFYKLTPLYPQDRLRLETEPHILTTRVIDLVMPIGKGQRALIVSPPKAGKTMVLQAVANAIAVNNPECHLMVVLVDERPEEVTDMQRSVKGEVIASTFDRPPVDHTTVAELAIERAKRLVELGHDVVVLLDSITRLGRAYNLAAPASGRILSGGIDSTALYPPKRFLGAARNIENGGSLTILATALVETGSMMDTVIFEEFKGTGNAELKLDRKIADKRVFPAIDIDPSSTRKEELLLAPDELGIIIKLRKVLHSLDSQAALDLLLDKLKQTRTNIEFLMQIAKSTPGE